MKNAIILHGQCSENEYYSLDHPSPSNSHWLPWLQKQLLAKDVVAHTPEVPKSFLLDYAVWKEEFERFDVTSETTIIAHSTGAGFVLRWLSEHQNQSVSKVILVAPCILPDNESENDFYYYTLDTGLVSRTAKVVVFISDDDGENMLKSVANIKRDLPEAVVREFKNHGHFTYSDLNGKAFPDLLAEVIL